MNSLSDKNVFVVPTADVTGCEDEYLVYAPLADAMTLASWQDCLALERALHDPSSAEAGTLAVLNSLLDGDSVRNRDGYVGHTHDFLLMYVLPNNICNFSCSYCFSAKGRGKGVLKISELKSALEWFIDPQRTESRKLAISYLGGGEPTLSWDVLKFGLTYGAELAHKYGFEIYTTVVTNGSKITREMVEVFNMCHVGVRVSFEILPEIQNLQRAHYEDVCGGLDLLCECDIPPMVRSMITPDNVCLLERMVEELHKRFPVVNHVLMDPITSAETFKEVKATREFYDLYYGHFIAARKLAESLGITLDCAPIRNLELVVERFCTGEFCLTPQGTITICHQVSSPREQHYEDFQYAYVDELTGKMVINEEKFQELKSRGTVYGNPKCKDCFIKWNCGGGCLMQSMQYSDEIQDVVCDFTRRFSKYYLLERIER